MINLKQLPKRIVLSRKGSDQSSGGAPSLIVEEELISLPIPEHSRKQRAGTLGRCNATHLRYADLPDHEVIGKHVAYMGQGLSKDDCVHLDPDVRPELRRPEAKSCTSLFGQSGTAESHLRNHQIGKNDLFLFFGWFRRFNKSGDWYLPEGPDQHMIWSWFQVEKKYLLEETHSNELQWAAHHPHIARMNGFAVGKDTLYVANEALSFVNDLPGAGTFRRSDARCLTALSCGRSPRRSDWCLPGFFRTVGLTYNDNFFKEPCLAEPQKVHLTAAGRGQEFVFPRDKKTTIQDLSQETQSQVAVWLQSVFQDI
ncbi:MAG: hypothetical protein ABI197_12450 [Granulicella sp.]